MVSYTDGAEVPFFGADLHQAGYLATQHLIALGRRRIGYIGDRIGSALCELRASGYRPAVREHWPGGGPGLRLRVPARRRVERLPLGYMIGERVAELADRPDAMFAFNDLGALGFQDALLDRGVRVPEDIAWWGSTTSSWPGRARVPLTTVRQPTDRIGALAVDTLLARLRGEHPEIRQLLPPQLVVRHSCGAKSAVMPADGRDAVLPAQYPDAARPLAVRP
jgi:LacI family transcriptional regulator